MLYASFAYVRADKIDRFRAWMERLPERRREAEQTYEGEGTRAEKVFLLEGRHGTIVAYLMEVDDIATARTAFAESKHPIDGEFKRLMAEVIERPVDCELIYSYQKNSTLQ